MEFRAFRFPYPVPSCPVVLFSTASHLELWLKNPRLLIPLFRFPSSFYKFNVLLLLTLRYIILDVYQLPTLSSAEKIVEKDNGSMCFFPLKAECMHIDLEIQTSIHIRNTPTFNHHSKF